MALENRVGGKYITIMGGKFVMRVGADTPGAVSRVNKKGNTVHELKYDSFTAKLINIRTRDSEYGPQWEFDFRDGGEVYTLQLSRSNSSATNFLKILPNVDLAKEMKIQPSQKIEGDKTKSSLFVSQNGVTLKHAYTKDAPNGLPQMVLVKVRGVDTWDDTDRLEFLQAMVERDIIPKLPKDANVAPSSEADAHAAEEVLGGTASADENDF